MRHEHELLKRDVLIHQTQVDLAAATTDKIISDAPTAGQITAIPDERAAPSAATSEHAPMFKPHPSRMHWLVDEQPVRPPIAHAVCKFGVAPKEDGAVSVLMTDDAVYGSAEAQAPRALMGPLLNLEEFKIEIGEMRHQIEGARQTEASEARKASLLRAYHIVAYRVSTCLLTSC